MTSLAQVRADLSPKAFHKEEPPGAEAPGGDISGNLPIATAKENGGSTPWMCKRAWGAERDFTYHQT